MTARAIALGCNGAAVLVAGAWMILAATGIFSDGAQRGAYWMSLPLSVLIAGQILLHRRSYKVAAVLMFLGGLGTLPLGVLAVAAALAVRSLGRRPEAGGTASAIRCSYCGYDLSGTRVPRCPECGRVPGFRRTARELGIEGRWGSPPDTAQRNVKGNIRDPD